ncbi:MAG: hypothetical protein FWG48_04080 [Oscillospiraceae bacterium]|nr:hypothetical protein [Oscillospiraceae bacterium]
MKRISKLAILSILLPLITLPCSAPASAATRFSRLEAKSAILAEPVSGTILFEHNARDVHPADHLARAMTLMLAVSAFENGAVDISRPVTVSETAWKETDTGSYTLGLTPGETITLSDLMYCAYVGEASDACNFLAECVAGSVGNFVSLMNERARELGCKNTHFVNTHGWYDNAQYTTAMDQFIIYREAMSLPMFAEISGTYRWIVGNEDDSDTYVLTSSNSMLNSSSKYYYRPCVSGITSQSYEGGYSFVAYAQSDGLTLVSVVLGSDVVVFEDQSALMRNLSESQRLLEWGFSNYSWRTVLSASELVAKAPVVHGDGADYVNLRPENSITILLEKNAATDDFSRDVTIYSVRDGEDLVAPVLQGDVLGEVKVTRGSEDYGTVLLVANTSIALHRFEHIKSQLKETLSGRAARIIIFVLFVIVAGYIALVVRYNVLRRRRLRRIATEKKRLSEEARGARAAKPGVGQSGSDRAGAEE